MTSSSVKVSIFGSTYSIQGDADPEYIRSLASFVDDKMNEVSRSVSSGNPLQVAILAALNIADEYHQLRTLDRSADDAVMRRANELITMLEQGLIGDVVTSRIRNADGN